MGNFYTRMLSYVFPNAECRILMLGIEGAGKTTVLHKLKFDKTDDVIPTTGFNVETISFQNLTINVWDITGQKMVRALWKYYFPNTTALVFVVDSSDTDRLQEAKEELHKLVDELELQRAHLIVFANKQDLPNAVQPDELAKQLDLASIRNRNWYIVGTNAKTGEGLFDGLMWLKNQMKA